MSGTTLGAGMAVETVAVADSKDAQEFRRALALAIERGESGAAALEAAWDVYTEQLARHRTQLQAYDAELRRLNGELRHHELMLKQVTASISRQAIVSAERAAHLQRHQEVERDVRELAAEIRRRYPELAARIEAVCDTDMPASGPCRPVVVAFVPDTRWRLGWFSDPGTAFTDRSLPFAGWMLTADTARAIGQRPEAAFVVDGRPVGLSMLQAWGWTLLRTE